MSYDLRDSWLIPWGVGIATAVVVAANEIGPSIEPVTWTAFSVFFFAASAYLILQGSGLLDRQFDGMVMELLFMGQAVMFLAAAIGSAGSPSAISRLTGVLGMFLLAAGIFIALSLFLKEVSNRVVAR